MNNINTTAADNLVAKRVAGGFNANESRSLLLELVAKFHQKNLGCALNSNAFSTARSCDKDAAALFAETI